jgi:hypothetical protein
MILCKLLNVPIEKGRYIMQHQIHISSVVSEHIMMLWDNKTKADCCVGQSAGVKLCTRGALFRRMYSWRR